MFAWQLSQEFKCHIRISHRELITVSYHYQNLSLTVLSAAWLSSSTKQSEKDFDNPYNNVPQAWCSCFYYAPNVKVKLLFIDFHWLPRTGSSILSWKTVKEKSINKLPICCYNINDNDWLKKAFKCYDWFFWYKLFLKHSMHYTYLKPHLKPAGTYIKFYI